MLSKDVGPREAIILPNHDRAIRSVGRDLGVHLRLAGRLDGAAERRPVGRADSWCPRQGAHDQDRNPSITHAPDLPLSSLPCGRDQTFRYAACRIDFEKM